MIRELEPGALFFRLKEEIGLNSCLSPDIA